MAIDRRAFIGTAAASAATLGFVPAALLGAPIPRDLGAIARNQSWDMSWVARITGRHRVVMDVPEIESGYGVWRSTIWANQYMQVTGAKPQDLSTVLVLRHNGIALAMKQSFWSRYGIGKAKNVTHPVTSQPTTVNPALLTSEYDGLAPELDALALPKFIARGGIALACSLALQDCADTIRKQDNVSEDEAHKRAVAELVPGVVLQPSGVFAAIRAQEAGCQYIRAT